ncbi:MAG TPA: 2-hydroxy-3-oxopropionate reductase [Anaerolineaceae bacterium]|nr:2-hydroxy-3-oxopropionate reductase [Anaerolineaceae bacterium]
MKPRIGFIGLGIMGKHMATHLLEAGYSLTVYDILAPAMDAVASKGAKRGLSCCDVATQSDLVISMVPDSPDIEQVALGKDGIRDAARPGLIYVDMSTISPRVATEVAQELVALGIRCLDAPVSGGETGARNATLSIMVGGPEDLFEEVKPVFEVLGKTITLCGTNGAGQIVKACNQIQVALNFVGMSEALVLGAKAGVDPAIILKVLSGGYAQTRVMDVRGPKLIEGDFEPGFKSKFHLKDLNIVMDTAKDLNVPLPATAVTQQLFTALICAGRGELDHSAVITILEDLAKVQARTHLEEKSK